MFRLKEDVTRDWECRDKSNTLSYICEACYNCTTALVCDPPWIIHNNTCYQGKMQRLALGHWLEYAISAWWPVGLNPRQVNNGGGKEVLVMPGFMVLDGQGDEIPVVTKDSLYTIVFANTRVLANGDRSLYLVPCKINPAVTLTPNYVFAFCILIKNSQKKAYIMNTLYIEWIFEQLLKQQNNFIFCLYHISL